MLLVDDDEAEPRSGANTAERAPTTMRASPRARRRHSSQRSPSPSPLCSTATALAEARAHAIDELVRERDLRHQHQRAALARERRGMARR